jgi:hypothetical protein
VGVGGREKIVGLTAAEYEGLFRRALYGHRR